MAIDWVKLELDVSRFDRSRFADAAASAADAGITITTLAVLSDIDTNRRRLYELNKELSADIPDRGEFHTWDQYRERRLEVPSFRPEGVVIAVDSDGEWIAFSSVSRNPDQDFCFNEMTGVRRTHRGRDLALVTKLATIDVVSGWGRAMVRTVHHPRNTSMIALNRKIGYTTATWPYPS